MQHVEPLAHHLADGLREKIVPPVAGQAEIGQFAAEGAERLLGLEAGEEALEMKPRMARHDLRAARWWAG